jgi:hypothetical protein
MWYFLATILWSVSLVAAQIATSVAPTPSPDCFNQQKRWFTICSIVDAGCTTVAGCVFLQDTNLTTLEGLNAVTSIRCFIIQRNNALTSLEGLENLVSMGGQLDITDNPVLSSLATLRSLITVGSFLSITNNPALSTLGLEGLISIGSWLAIQGNTALTSLASLSNLATVASCSSGTIPH